MAGAWLSEARGDEPEPLDEEFLDYLLQLEGEEEDWTLFDSQQSESPSQATAKPSTTKSSEAQPAPAKEPVAKSSSAPAAAPAKPTIEDKR